MFSSNSAANSSEGSTTGSGFGGAVGSVIDDGLNRFCLAKSATAPAIISSGTTLPLIVMLSTSSFSFIVNS